jgi:hypothetical protein
MELVMEKPGKKVRLIEYCPYCGDNFMIMRRVELNPDSLTNILIKPHENCDEFIVTLDLNGVIRGTMTVDKGSIADTNKVNKYMELFNRDEAAVLFYHIQDMCNTTCESASAGTIMTTKVKYHGFARSPFYHNWIQNFKSSNSEFSFMITEEIILATLNLFDMIRLTVGFDVKKMLEKNAPINSIQDTIDFIKGQVVQYGEQILN